MPSNQLARLLIAFSVVGFWMLLGWLLRLDANSYLLVGVPLLLFFQLFIAQRTVPELWLRSRFRITALGTGAAVVCGIYPTISLLREWPGSPWSIKLWGIAAVLGALPLGITLSLATRKTWGGLFLCFLAAGLAGSGLMILTSLAIHHGFHPRPNAVRVAARSFLLYLPVCFVIEEVFFRGGLDSYVQREGDRRPWVTAVLISCLWGWWHLPLVHPRDWIQFTVFAVTLPVIHCIPGIAFSVYWRKSGSLLVPATVHAFIDSVRNAMI